ncbi:MAG: hypothetical protein QOJ03_838 [Frankiaceae bacterium]|jgi:hypothetical protein|nr:hypothetical protein [Frankiaceae bacterium]
MPGLPRASLAAALVAVTGSLLVSCSGGSSAPAASPSPTPSPSVTPSPHPIAVKTCPLTGVPPRGEQKINRVALAVKIDNVGDARPQAGLDYADLVIEETVEGGLTRLMAVFQCDKASNVGPIRSARTSDGDLLRLLDGAVFGYSGANPQAIAPVRATGKAELIAYDSLPQYFHRDGSRPAPHNVFSSTATILAAGIARNHKLHAPRTVFSYGKTDHPGRPVKTASMTWPSASAIWTWNGKAWLRTQSGTADVLADGHRVSAANVVVMSIAIASTGLHDVLGNASPDDVVTGHGKVWVLRDGHVFTGTWNRAKRANRMKLRTSTGKTILLHPGRTWIELLPRPRVPSLS